MEYFTPAIEDIRVGYECEKRKLDFSRHIDLFLPEGATKEDYDKAWDDFYNTSDKVEYEKFVVDGDTIRFVERAGVRGTLRVPYLTKEQIEGEGWIYQLDFNSTGTRYRKGDYFIDFTHSNYTLIVISANTENLVAYHGKCRDINTFRLITKLLNI